MKKSQRIAEFVSTLEADADNVVGDPRYAGYFTLFNEQRYYEAHDVLEDLWLEDRSGADGQFYKALIQFAGAFVHLQKGRLPPGARLFALARKNLGPFAPHRHQLHVAEVCGMCDRYQRALEASQFLQNPWSPGHAPRLELERVVRD